MSEGFEWTQKAAEQGFAPAQYYLGIYYQHGTGIDKDEIEAFHWWRKAAEQGYAEAQYHLALQFSRLFQEGDGVKRYQEKYRDEMKKWIKKAAEQGHEDAMRIVNNMEDRHAEEDLRIQERAEQGDADFQYLLSVSYLHGIYGVEQDFDEAVKWSQRAAEQGQERAQQFLDYIADNNIVGLQEPAGQFMLGTFYLCGIGIPPDCAKAVTWLQKAAEQGHEEAQQTLDRIWFAGIREAAEQGHAEALVSLYCCYCDGTGVDADKQEATKWLQKAAEQGNAEASVELATYYIDNNDAEEAVKWLRKAAALGHAMAARNLGNCYINAFGVEQDYDEAVKWFRIAAELSGSGAVNCD